MLTAIRYRKIGAACLKYLTVVLCLIGISENHVLSQIRLPRLISDGMIIQRDMEIRIWGWASVGEEVAVDFNGIRRRSITDEQSQWIVTFPAMQAGGPYTMEIKASNRVLLNDIWIGDVWVCSGQSNMELPMVRVKPRFEEAIASSTNPKIRQFDVSTRYAFASPKDDLEEGTWVDADPGSVLKFTAVGYFFARELYEKYKVPIGLIKSAVGGSPAEAWLSENTLKSYPHYLAIHKKYRDSLLVDSIKKADAAIIQAWNARIDSSDLGLQGKTKWYDEAYRPERWKNATIPGYWDDWQIFDTRGQDHLNGVVWFRKEIEVPESMVGKPAMLVLGAIVDRDEVYVNGTLVGTTGYQYPPRRYPVPVGLLKKGKNIVVLRVISNVGRGGFVKGKEYMLQSGKERIDLSGTWQCQLGYASNPMPGGGVTFHYQPGGLFNGMIAPLLNYAIKGVIWYQGESNTDRAAEYQSLFPDLINDWRKNWHRQNLPFLYVQLANFMEPRDQPSESGWAALRYAQFKALDLPNTAMAVTIDVGEANDIHPLDKETVGKRLSLAARKMAYGEEKLVYTGPLYKSFRLEDNKVIIDFFSAGSPLKVTGGELQGFAIAGPDGKFIWANARIDGNEVLVWHDSIAHPTAVRYAWADNPVHANLYNEAGLPASPFEVDLK
ncbi:sialate O-acetylesterase [Olivibacter sitiensis]|uniref:sialate O-acetylesterase n=1 Tax=Olivibacter sitiensis TaxID=376470 RepID=UPI00040460FF|nr:sialate O-acetylesterase [Olivibacter sitiensis]